jgi:glycosyltransferase involved in cell wall biosynthesis
MLSKREKRTAHRGFDSADAVFAVSPGLANVLRQGYCSQEIHVIPNLVAERFFAGGLRKEPMDRFRFISVGTLEYKKGQDVLIRAFARVAEEIPETKLTIVGEGPYYEPLKAWAAELGVAEKVELTWMLSREEVAARLRESQAFVLPSRTETFGVVFIEAMACGLPIVMTKTNAWELLVNDDTGIAVEIDDEDALTDAMLRVIRNYGGYDPQKIRSFCEERFSAGGVAEQLTGWYREVLRAKGRDVK